MDDGALQSAMEAARGRAVAWLRTMQAPGEPAGVCRISGAHDPACWPGMKLPGTYNAVMCLRLLGEEPDDPAPLRAWLLRHRRPGGVFRIPGMEDRDVFKKPDKDETWRYIDFHVTNYAQGALEALGDPAPPVLDFARPWLDVAVLKAWLADRDLRDPWQEGNNIVNLGGFLLGLRRWHGADAAPALAALFAWHDRLQEPATGFWGVGQLSDGRALLHAMAGAMHNFHLFYATGRKLPYHEKAIDYALGRPTAVDSACIDVDLVDLLVHGHALTAHRTGEIETWLRAKAAALLAFQSPDGGFADETSGTRWQDGWVGGYTEPQGLSNTFATWFRWIALAMAADTLWPGWRHWRFRAGVGIGYRLGRPA